VEFAAMSRGQCAACHRPGAADDGCTQCHNYHVGQAGLAHSWPSTLEGNRLQPD
jgi:hypothetical protein